MACSGSDKVLGEERPLSRDAEEREPEEGAAAAPAAAAPADEDPSTGPEVFEGAYFTAELAGGREETYVELTPPAPLASKAKELRPVDAFVVLDCSGSMQGRRMAAANTALRELYQCPQLASLTVICFGSKVAPRKSFRKRDVGALPAFEADLGTTNFIPPLGELKEALLAHARKAQDSTPHGDPVAVFISDGACNDNPRSVISGLAEVLRSLACPLMSVAITTAVTPDVMVALADMHGDLPLLLVREDTAEEQLPDQLLRNLPLDGSHETVRVSFVHADTGAVVESRDCRFTRDGTSVELMAPPGVPFKSLLLRAAVVESDSVAPAEIRLQRLGGDAPEGAETDPVLRLSCHGRALLRIARAVVGAFIKGELPREQAEERVMGLRAAFSEQLGAGSGEGLSRARAPAGAEGAALSREERTKVVAMLRAWRTVATEVQQEFNKLLEAVGRNDVRAALAAYSEQTLAPKHNKRIGEIARQNAARPQQSVSEEVALRVLRSYEGHGDAEREMALCLLWLCNPYEAMSGFAGVDQGDWVGRAVFVVPGRVAALNCWRMEQVLVRPLNVTKSVIPQIVVDETDGKRRAVVNGTGFPEFNACLPMISPGEHVGAVRLAIHCMKNSTEGRGALADLVCGSKELYDGAMVNAVYVTAVLSSLACAKAEADFDGALRALLTTVDLANAEGAQQYWAGIFDKLQAGSAFIACKEPDALPDVARAFVPLICSDAAYAAPEEAVRDVCAKLFVRVALDQTSERLGVLAALGIDEKALDAKCVAEAARASDEELDVFMQDLAAAAAAAEAVVPEQGVCGFKLHTSKVALMYGLHVALRRAGFCQASRLVDDVMDGAAPPEALLDVLRAACGSGAGAAALAGRVLGCEDGAAALRDLLVVCCHGELPGAAELRRHDGKYISACFEGLERCGGVTAEGLRAFAAEIRQNALAAVLRRAVGQAHFDRHKLDIVRGFAHRAEKFLEEHPWESHRHEMPELSLGFTADERSFGTRAQLWAALQDGWYHAEDLQELHDLTKETVKDFDLDLWKASHRHFLPGYHIYSRKNLSLSGKDLEGYVSRMKEDLENHYAGHNGALYKREYTPKMKAWVEPYARHIFQEAQVATAVGHACRSAAAGSDSEAVAEAVLEQVWAQFPELDSLAPERKAARRRHVRALVSEAFARVAASGA